MIYVLGAIILLFVSFFIALVSLIVEQRKLERIQRENQKEPEQNQTSAIGQKTDEKADDRQVSAGASQELDEIKKNKDEERINWLEDLVRREQTQRQTNTFEESRASSDELSDLEQNVRLPREEGKSGGQADATYVETPTSEKQSYQSQNAIQDRAEKLTGQIKISKLNKD